MKLTKTPTNKQHKQHNKTNKPVHTTAKRNIISYQTQKGAKFYRAQAKKISKQGEKRKAQYHLDPKQANPVGLTPKELPNGTTVHIFKEREPKVSTFGKITHLKRPRTKFDPETGVNLIHEIATNVAQVPPRIIQESGIKTAQNKYFFNSAELTAADYSANTKSNHIVRFATPTFLEKAVMWNRRPGPKSKNQQARWKQLLVERNGILQNQKETHAEFIKTLEESHLQLLKDMGVEDLTNITSTDDKPIEFGNNLGLKFRITDAVIKATHIEVPSTALANIKNTRDLANWVLAKHKELSTRAHYIPKGSLPDNVTFIFTAPVDRTKKPKWIEYKELREKKTIAGATSDV